MRTRSQPEGSPGARLSPTFVPQSGALLAQLSHHARQTEQVIEQPHQGSPLTTTAGDLAPGAPRRALGALPGPRWPPSANQGAPGLLGPSWRVLGHARPRAAPQETARGRPAAPGRPPGSPRRPAVLTAHPRGQPHSPRPSQPRLAPRSAPRERGGTAQQPPGRPRRPLGGSPPPSPYPRPTLSPQARTAPPRSILAQPPRKASGKQPAKREPAEGHGRTGTAPQPHAALVPGCPGPLPWWWCLVVVGMACLECSPGRCVLGHI